MAALDGQGADHQHLQRMVTVLKKMHQLQPVVGGPSFIAHPGSFFRDMYVRTAAE